MVTTTGCAQPPTVLSTEQRSVRATPSIPQTSTGDKQEGGPGVQPLSQAIKQARSRARLTLQQVADTARTTRGYLSQIETGKRQHISEHLLTRLETALHLQPGELVTLAHWHRVPDAVRAQLRELKAVQRKAELLAQLLEEKASLDQARKSGLLARLVRDLAPLDDQPSPQPTAQTAPHSVHPMHHESLTLPIQVPLIHTFTAEHAAEFTDPGYPARIADQHISIPDIADPNAFATRVEGDTMQPSYQHNDIVVFSPRATTHTGSDCLVHLEHNAQLTFTRVYFEQSDAGQHMVRLQPLNPKYAPTIVPREEITGIYTAVYVLRAVEMQSS